MCSLRSDDRSLEEFRNVFFKTKVISHAKGSSYVEIGDSKVMVAILGPRQAERKAGFTEKGRLNCEVKLTSFATAKQERQEQIALEQSLANSILQALSASVRLDMYPKVAFDVQVMFLESGGSDLPVAISAASLALADAGVALLDLVSSCQVSRSKVREALLLDPTIEEESAQDGAVTVAMMASLGEITFYDNLGGWTAAAVKDAQRLAIGGCVQLRSVMRETLLASMAK
mmetsp:Transcript_34263/g.61816  ORF Transcript_34263/g.61816 Transcript_34263/m.61816 type:complete len:230 (-) Transcript_34263:194-883(-)